MFSRLERKFVESLILLFYDIYHLYIYIYHVYIINISYIVTVHWKFIRTKPNDVLVTVLSVREYTNENTYSGIGL